MLLFFGTNQKGAYDRELQMCCMHVYVIFNILLHFFFIIWSICKKILFENGGMYSLATNFSQPPIAFALKLLKSCFCFESSDPLSLKGGCFGICSFTNLLSEQHGASHDSSDPQSLCMVQEGFSSLCCYCLYSELAYLLHGKTTVS